MLPKMSKANEEGHLAELSQLQPSTTVQAGESHVIDHVLNRPPQRLSLLSLSGLGLVVGTVWPNLGGSIAIALAHGGSPGVLYEFIVVSFFYGLIGASLAELASAMPSSAGVYVWSSITPGSKLGRPLGFFAGWWNYLAWIMGLASVSSIAASIVVSMYGYGRTAFTPQPWINFVTYVLITWTACLFVCFANKAIPMINKLGIFFLLAGGVVVITVSAAMPALEGGRGHQSNRVVWMEWAADVGYPEAVVFVSGMLNGAFAMGTPDAISHLAEEIHSPETNVPKAMALQIGLGFISGFAFLVPMLYAINDFDALQTSSFPLGELYRQATWTNAGAIGLLCVTLLPVLGCVIGLYVTAGRTLWTLARDGATPRSAYFGKVHRSLAMPMRATLLSAVLTTLIGGIALASSTAFQSFVSSFIQMSTASYMASLMPFVLRRRRGLRFGPFKMPDILGMCVNSAACIYMVLAFGIYCLPSSLPTSAKTINYAPVIWAGCTALIALFWTCFAGKRYSGPRLPIT